MAAQPRTEHIHQLSKKRPRTRAAAAPVVAVVPPPAAVTTTPTSPPAREPWKPQARSRLTIGFWRRTALPTEVAA